MCNGNDYIAKVMVMVMITFKSNCDKLYAFSFSAVNVIGCSGGGGGGGGGRTCHTDK